MISNPMLYNGFHISPNLRIGAWSTGTEPPTAEQITNANNIKSFFMLEGWSLQAICGMLGNMQAESTINPAMIQQTHRSRLPDSGTDLDSLPNAVMKNFFAEYYLETGGGYGIGLVQWDGYTQTTTGQQQKLVAYAIRNQYNWYDGYTQCYRLRGEWQLDDQYGFFNPVTVNGHHYTFASYVTSTNSPEELAEAWQRGYERNAGGLGYRGTNARYWYNLFTGSDAPDPVTPRPPKPASDYPVPDGQEDSLLMILLTFAQRRKPAKCPLRKI